MFENPEIAVEQLPAADDVEWRPIDGRFVRLLQLRALARIAILAAGLLILMFLRSRIGFGFPVWLAWILLVVISAKGLAWPPISVPRMGYAVRERDVVYRSGVIWRRVTAIPFNRVQHVETGSRPLDRRFGLASLQLYTAGGSGADLKVEGLPAEIAERLRVFVLGRVGAAVERV